MSISVPISHLDGQAMRGKDGTYKSASAESQVDGKTDKRPVCSQKKSHSWTDIAKQGLGPSLSSNDELITGPDSVRFEGREREITW